MCSWIICASELLEKHPLLFSAGAFFDWTLFGNCDKKIGVFVKMRLTIQAIMSVPGNRAGWYDSIPDGSN